MPQVTVTIHPNGLHPIEAVKAFYKRSAEHMSLDEIVEEGELMNISKKPAGRDAINSAILRVENMSWGGGRTYTARLLGRKEVHNFHGW